MSLGVGARLGHYEVTALIGEGGMGQVYQATDTKLNRQVALKILPEAFAEDPDRLARFQREAQVLASLNHPNIGAIHGIEDSEGTKALVLELVEGPTLADRIAQGPIPVDEALPIAKQIAEALEAAHEAGVIHRDLKPANIKVREDGTVKVLDFGLAKALDTTPQGDPSQSPTLTAAATQMGVIMGTAAYMAPEQARGKAVDKRADIFAFGVVLYEMLTGQRPFQGDDVSLTLAEVMKSHPDWSRLPGESSPPVRQLLLRCLEKEPRRRLRDIGEARISLEMGEAGGLEKTSSDEGRQRTQGWLGWGVAALLALVALSLGVGALRRSDPDPRLIQFPLVLPVGTSLAPGPSAPQLAVSPDGRHLAFAAVDSSGVSQLWVRDLDSMAARVIPDTADAFFPFWSPDSLALGFQTRTHVKTVELSGGDVRTICESANRNGATWNTAGVIVFTSEGRGLDRVSAGGGIPESLTTPDDSRQETAHMWPQFLPDGRHFLYFARSAEDEHQGVYVASLDGAAPKLLLATSVRALYAAGHLLFMRGDTLMAQPLDLSRLELTGAPIPIAEDVTYNPEGTNRAGFTASDSVLAFRTGGIGGTPTSQLVWFDRSGNRLETVGPPGPYGNLALSPDESRVAFDRIDSRTGTADVWIHDLRRGNESQLTFDEAEDRNPLFSPNGTRVVFSSGRSGSDDLYLKDASGAGEAEMLLGSTQNTVPSDWSEHGAFVLVSWPPTGLAVTPAGRDVATLSAVPDGQVMPLLAAEANEIDARISPSGRWLAFAADVSGRYEVYVVAFPEQEGRWLISTNGGTDPWWSGDEKELFYLDPENRLLAVRVNGEGSSFEHDTPIELFQPNVTSLRFAFRNPYVAARDGQRFLMNVQEADTNPTTVVVNWLTRVQR